ncbi:hypothetical protein CASFOL_026647 [Castilleja foliolosa]|uniref:Uncharacterized protein n=1 Tax=Castilleja foliolosa TaxID=1961234 RepID=A0ABD3CL00_9LAMI
MTEKAKPKKHNAKELAAKVDAAITNWGRGKAVEPWARGFAAITIRCSAVEPWAAVICGFAAARCFFIILPGDPSFRESDVKDYWLDRNKRILDWLLCERSFIICLQEFWVGNEELVNIYDKRLGDAGYINFKLARTNNRGDGTRLFPLMEIERSIQKET